MKLRISGKAIIEFNNIEIKLDDLESIGILERYSEDGFINMKYYADENLFEDVQNQIDYSIREWDNIEISNITRLKCNQLKPK